MKHSYIIAAIAMLLLCSCKSEKRIATYEARIAETQKLTADEVAKFDWVECAWHLLDCHALTEAKRKLFALDAVK